MPKSNQKIEIELSKIDRCDSSFQWCLGLACASIFSLSFILTPLYAVSSIFLLLIRPSVGSLIYATPLLISSILPPIPSKTAVSLLRPMLSYFEYEQIIETSPVDIKQQLREGKNFIIPAQPHGVISFCGICSSIYSPEFSCDLKSAVASAVLFTPILKHVMGIFGLVDASRTSLKKHLQKKGTLGSVVIYVGGLAELFLSSRDEEILYLAKRKGFIKLALREGVDIVPIYLFGNTSVLTVLKTGFLAEISRKLQVSLTFFWGKWGLPIPRDEKLLYVGGQPLGMPQISEPTQEDIDKWHAKYCTEVTRLFNTYKERVPLYKHKKLVIV